VSPRWRPLPDREGPGPRPVGASLDRVAASLGGPRAATWSGVFSSWADLVGPSVAAHARPRRLEATVLHVAVDDPAWATQLRWLEGDLLRRLTEVLGEGAVTAIEVRVRPPDAS
jgi:predicted nucleic acid-binding Zn ribbon protein